MTSTILAPVRAQIAAVIASLSPTVKAYAYPPGLSGLDSLPCGVIEGPRITRTDPDQKETDFRGNDWREDWSVLFFFDLNNAEYAATQAEETVEDFIKAIDAATNANLDSTNVVDWKVTRSDYSVIEDRARTLLFYDCTLSVLQTVP